MYKLIIQDDEGKTTVVPLIRDEISIGRKEGNTIRLTERNVSRRHARIVKSNGAVVVEDLDSYNGVKVNGTRIQGRVPVGEADRIQIGDYLLELKVDRGAEVYPPGSQGSQGPSIPGAPYGQSPMGAGIAMGAGMPSSGPPPTPLQGSNGSHPSAAQHLRAPKTTQPMTPTFPDGVPQTSMPMAETVPEPSVGAGLGSTAPMPIPMPMGGVAPHIVPPAPGTASGMGGRLVVVSSNFGGREFILDKPTMVIGRTDDNDIVVNHRSISRHHAKVVLEQGRYCIVDMQSSNGVRVNGEDYGKVELRRGDMIDLGHVRLRYVEPGEDFVFHRDAQLVDVATRDGGRGRGALWAGLSVLLVGAAVVVFFVTQRRQGTPVATSTAKEPVAAAPPLPSPEPRAPTVNNPEPTVAAPQPTPVNPPTNPTPAVAPPPSATADAASAGAAPEKPAVEPAPQGDAVIADARKALAEERWIAARDAAEQVLKAEPANAEASKIQEQANGEFRNQTAYEHLKQARDAKKAVEVARHFREITETSVYHPRAQADVEKFHDQYLREREAEARGYAARGQCDRIGALARRAAEVFPDARAAVEKAGSNCAPIAARPVITAPEEQRAPEPLAQRSDAEVTALLLDAKAAARNFNWSDARKKAEEVLRQRPGDQDALSVAGIAACNLVDKDRAARYIEKLKGERKNMMKQICASRGVLIE